MTTSEKTCFKCEKVKPLVDFYKHTEMADGHVNKCKECNKFDVSSNYRKNIIHYKNYERGRTHLPHRVKARKFKEDGDIGLYCVVPGESCKNAWRKRNPKKKYCHTEVYKALKNGRLKKGKCEICGEVKVHGHHDDYNKPLIVRWLCSKHHIEHHKQTLIQVMYDSN